MLWRHFSSSTMLLLLLASVMAEGLASASPQGNYGYPSSGNTYGPAKPQAPPTCPQSTSVVYTTLVQSSIAYKTINLVDTKYSTTTLVHQRVVPTTQYHTQVVTRTQYQTSVVHNTLTYTNNRFVTRTLDSPPVIKTHYLTSDRVVPQVNYVTHTQVQTQVVPQEIVRTQIRTLQSTLVHYTTQKVQYTDVVTLPGGVNTKTIVQTLLHTEVVQKPGPVRYLTTTTTQFDQQVFTYQIPSPPITKIKTVVKETVIPTTVVETRLEKRVLTRQIVVTDTSVITQTRFNTQVVYQEDVQTQVVPTTIHTTLIQTQVKPLTKTNKVIQTQYVTPFPVLQTVRVTSTSVVQVPGEDHVEYSQVLKTQHKQQVVYQTVNQPKQVVVTHTITASCKKAGYNYPEPANPLGFRVY